MTSFSPLPGAIDFSAQVAESLQLLTTIPVSINLPQAKDITAVLYPNLQALLIVWQADPSQIGQQLIVSATLAGSTFGAGPQQATLLDDSGSWLVPAPSSIVTSLASNAQIGLQRPTGAPTPVIGTLYVFGVMSNPLSVPVVRRAFIGQGATSGQVTIGASSTGTVLAFPNPGTYYRIKLLGFTTVAAPGAAGRLSFRTLSGHLIVWSFVVPALANQTFSQSLDWETDDGLELVNGLTAGAPVTVAYEVWRA